MYGQSLLALASLPLSALAWSAPAYAGDGMQTVWQDDFAGESGKLPSFKNWEIIEGDLKINNERQWYRKSAKNLQTSGGNTLQVVPWRDSTAENGKGWTSGRVESTYTFTPENGKKTRAEAQIRFGSNPVENKRGIWPAFWLIGSVFRKDHDWPACGELDIMETVNFVDDGQLQSYGTTHCDKFPGGICNEGQGIGKEVNVPIDSNFHTWRIEWDRTASSWEKETIRWSVDGREFHVLEGWQFERETLWATIAHKPMYFILNLAVGGDWPGEPQDDTLDGYGSMMEVGYVAHYTT